MVIREVPFRLTRVIKRAPWHYQWQDRIWWPLIISFAISFIMFGICR